MCTFISSPYQYYWYKNAFSFSTNGGGGGINVPEAIKNKTKQEVMTINYICIDHINVSQNIGYF